jgi:hypothetical protein
MIHDAHDRAPSFPAPSLASRIQDRRAVARPRLLVVPPGHHAGRDCRVESLATFRRKIDVFGLPVNGVPQ